MMRADAAWSASWTIDIEPRHLILRMLPYHYHYTLRAALNSHHRSRGLSFQPGSGVRSRPIAPKRCVRDGIRFLRAADARAIH